MAPQSKAQGGEEALISGLRLGNALTSAASGKDNWLCLCVRRCGANGDKVTICEGGERWDTGLKMRGTSEGSLIWGLSLSQLSQLIPQGGLRGEATSYRNLSTGSV